MKKIYLMIITFLLTSYNYTFAADTGIFGTCVRKADIRNGDIHTDDIPCIIQNAIDVFMGIAGTVSVVFIIIGAYQILFGSLSKDTTKGKTTITYAIAGFVLAASSWLIIKFILGTFS
ncbi:MAG: pilin [Candidatus Gracilibacteria bacterium]|nr:pilin [Candidatus Gracilibacteria bacterium]